MQLSPQEHTAMARIHLGGLEALRTETYHCACSTVAALIRKGLLDKRGLTAEGRRVADECGRPE